MISSIKICEIFQEIYETHMQYAQFRMQNKNNLYIKNNAIESTYLPDMELGRFFELELDPSINTGISTLNKDYYHRIYAPFFIEYVKNPKESLQLLKSAMREDGVLILYADPYSRENPAFPQKLNHYNDLEILSLLQEYFLVNTYQQLYDTSTEPITWYACINFNVET